MKMTRYQKKRIRSKQMALKWLVLNNFPSICDVHFIQNRRAFVQHRLQNALKYNSLFKMQINSCVKRNLPSAYVLDGRSSSRERMRVNSINLFSAMTQYRYDNFCRTITRCHGAELKRTIMYRYSFKKINDVNVFYLKLALKWKQK